jgi:hypothetical protein
MSSNRDSICVQCVDNEQLAIELVMIAIDGLDKDSHADIQPIWNQVEGSLTLSADRYSEEEWNSIARFVAETDLSDVQNYFDYLAEKGDSEVSTGALWDICFTFRLKAKIRTKKTRILAKELLKIAA